MANQTFIEGTHSRLRVSMTKVILVEPCGSLMVTGPRKFKESGPVRKCGFAGISIALEEVCHCEL